jgi:hypothetical protein
MSWFEKLGERWWMWVIVPWAIVIPATFLLWLTYN